MIKSLIPLLGLLLLISCNPVTHTYSLVYTTEEPNEAFAMKLEEVLEDAYYKVDIRLSQAQGAQSIIDSLQSGQIDMGLVENLVNYGDGIRSVVPVYPKMLHIFYKSANTPASIAELFYDKKVYIGRMGSAAYDFMLSFFEFHQLEISQIQITTNMLEAEVLALFSVLMNDAQLKEFDGFELYSLDQADQLGKGTTVEGISLKNPRVRPFVLPKGTYGAFTEEPVVTLCTDMMYVVREGMGDVAVSDLIRALFAHREKFVQVHPSFYYGIVESFDRSKLSHPLHEGARAYLDRDEPGFFERYAELAGVVFTILIASASGIVSLSKWRRQRKKDKVDVFYAHLMKIKNEMNQIRTVAEARAKIAEIKEEQNKAFTMLINEELEANDSFRIYMELSKETIDEIRNRLKLILAKTGQ